MIKDSLNNICDSYKKILHQNEKLNQEVEVINNTIDRRIKICENTPQILDNSMTEFKNLTSILNRKDIPFFKS